MMANDFSGRPTLVERLTVAHLAGGVLVLLALALRLVDIGVRPLAPVEAETAWRAWQASQGLRPALDGGAPLLFTLQTVTFFLASASDGLARLWPLLASVALIVVVYDWRHWAGTRPALLAALLLTLSPLVNAFGRRGDATTFVLLALALSLTGWARVRLSQPGGGKALAVGLGLLFISGPAAPTALLALAVVMLLARTSLAPSRADAAAFLVVLLLGGGAFLTRIDALGLAAINWSEWLAAWSLSPSSLLWGLLRLILDEPLLVVLGLATMVGFWRSGSWQNQGPIPVRTLAAAAIVAMLVAVFQGQYAAGSRAVAAVLLALPVARFLLWLLYVGDYDLRNAEALIYFAALQILTALAVFALISYSSSGQNSQLVLLGVTAAVALAVSLIFAYFLGRKLVLSMAALAVVLSLVLFNQAAAWGLAFDAQAPRFSALYQRDARPSIEDLVVTVTDLSQRRHSERWALPIAVIASGSSDAAATDAFLLWYLRQAPDLRLVRSVDLETAPPLVVAPEARELTLSERFAGQRFHLFDAWSPADAGLRQQIAWMLFRTAPWDLPVETIVLWADSQTLSLE